MHIQDLNLTINTSGNQEQINGNNLSFLKRTMEEPNFHWKSTLDTIRSLNMSEKELAEALLIVKAKEEELIASSDPRSRDYCRLKFELKELLFRAAFAHESSLNNLIDFFREHSYTTFTDQLFRLKENKPLLTFKIPLNSSTNANPFEGVSFNSSYSLSKELPLNDRPRVLHASLEYIGAEVAGVYVVAKELTLAQNANNQDSRIVTPLYDSYIQEKSEELRFISTLDHFYEGSWRTSSVYELKGSNGQVIQYLIKPDSTHLEVFDLQKKHDVYKDFFGKDQDSYRGFCQRTQFFVSAVAPFASSYVGTNGEEPFEVLHLQSWSFTLGAALIKSCYNPIREASLIAKPLTVVSHIHGYGIVGEQGRHFSPDIFHHLGLPFPENLVQTPNMQLHGYSQSDADIHVSTWQAEYTKTREGGLGLNVIACEKRRQNRFYGISNGVFRDNYIPTNRKIYGDYAYEIKKENGVNITDYVSQRNKVKSALFNKGIIASADKPLFLYVGRLEVPTKGVDALPTMVHKIHGLGGQCVVMGRPEGANQEMEELEKLEKLYPESLKFYKDPDRDQKAPFEESAEQKVEKGKLIRLAADFVIVPSHREPDGLVPKESLTTGALLITSAVDGIAAAAKGFHTAGQAKFNSFTYTDDANFKTNGATAVNEAMSYWKEISIEAKNQLIGRLIDESERFDWKNTVGLINDVYRRAMIPQTREEKNRLLAIQADCYRRNFTYLLSPDASRFSSIETNKLFPRKKVLNDQKQLETSYTLSDQNPPLELSQDDLKPFVRYAAACAAVHETDIERWLRPFDGGTFQIKMIEGKLKEIAEKLHLRTYGGVAFDPKSGFKATIFESNEELLVVFGGLGSLDNILWVAEDQLKISQTLENPRLDDGERKILNAKLEAIEAQKRAAIKAQTYSIIAQNILGFVPIAFEQADEFVFGIRSCCSQQKPIRIVGHSIGGALATYSALSNGLEARCFNSLPLGSGLQTTLGKETLRDADRLVIHIGVKGDYVSDNPTLQPLFDRMSRCFSLPLPRSVGLRCSIPSYYTDPEKAHTDIIGNIMQHLDHNDSDDLDTLFQLKDI